MIVLTLEQLADVVGGELVDVADARRRVDAVTIDSRTAAPGALFVPLPGERADGHDFIADAVVQGASGYLAAAGRPLPLAAAGAVVVDDPADALLALGAWVRETVDPLAVGVTGSNGKTTTKDLIATAVGADRAVVASAGSYNNELGVPLTLCRLEPSSEVLVAELGARGRGQIARLVPVVRPDIAVVTTVSGAHLEQFGTVDAVAVAKAELVEGLRADGLAVLNADDHRVAAMAAHAPGRVATYGRGADAEWRAEDVELDAFARPRFRVRGQDVALPLPGEHNVGNAVAALAVADACGVPLARAAQALEHAAVSRWRMELRRTTDGVVVLNDAYNANPASMEAALRTFARMRVTGRRWAVLGRMAELGLTAEAAHDRIGRLVAQLGVDGLIVVVDPQRPEATAIRAGAVRGTGARVPSGVPEGTLGRPPMITDLVADPGEAVALLERRLRPGDAVLVKASRAAGLERVAEGLLREGARLLDEGGGQGSTSGSVRRGRGPHT
ncbi:MAG: UDP-N-acetylmuramoyl-tripeptide--D-alanyl-D-alanine ligase [Egibacteraceae bacterium]